jgi:DNA-binding MarR family transcriptional regulator
MNSSQIQEAAPKEADQEPLLELQHFLPHKLNVLSSLVSQALTRVYGRYGIGIPEWRVLVSLGQFGVMTGKAIGARTHMHKTKVSRAVAQLEQRKFLTRRTNRDDLREAFLSLTPAGRAVYEELAPRALDFTERLSEVVSPSDRAAFDRAMQQLTERSAKLVGDPENTNT